jgi:hypothetical protein
MNKEINLRIYEANQNIAKYTELNLDLKEDMLAEAKTYYYDLGAIILSMEQFTNKKSKTKNIFLSNKKWKTENDLLRNKYNELFEGLDLELHKPYLSELEKRIKSITPLENKQLNRKYNNAYEKINELIDFYSTTIPLLKKLYSVKEKREELEIKRKVNEEKKQQEITQLNNELTKLKSQIECLGTPIDQQKKYEQTKVNLINDFKESYEQNKN